jgi:O-antigen/teichoic acid export membrane protein
MTINQTPIAPEERPAAVRSQFRRQGWIFVAGGVAFLLGALSAVSPAVALIALAISITLIVGWWAAARGGDALVVAVALLVFWAPFHTTVSQFNLSPQEVGVYFILLACLMLDRRGLWNWLLSFIFSIPLVSLIAIGLFALACLQAVVFEHGVSLGGRLQGLRPELLYPVLFALLIAYTVRSRKVERLLFQAFFAGGVALAAYALTLKLWGVDIANGAVAGRLGAEASILSQYHPNNLGLYFAFALPFALPLWREAAESWDQARLRKTAILLGVFLLTLDILLTASRGTLVALAISGLVGLCMLLWLGTWAQRAITGAIAFGAAAGIAALALSGKASAFGRYAALLNPKALLANPNVQFRLTLYERAWALIKSHPLTGIGLQAFSATSSAPYSPHDTYLDLWVSIGILGLLAFLFVLALGVWSMFRWANYHRRAGDQVGLYYCLSVILAISCFITQGFVEAFDAQPRIAPVIWMLALVAQVASFRPRVSAQTATMPRFPRLSRPTAPPPVAPGPRGVRPTPLIAPPPADWSGRIEDLEAGPIPPAASTPSVPGTPAEDSGAPPHSEDTTAPPRLERGQVVGPLAGSHASGAEYEESAPEGADIDEHPPLPAPQVPLPDSYEASARLWQPPTKRVTGAPESAHEQALAGGADERKAADADWDWDWDYHTGPALMVAQNTLPLIEGDAFHSSNIFDAISIQRETAPRRVAAPGRASTGEAEALLKRAPASYVWNQVYSILIFAMSFVLSIVIARGLSATDFGVYTMLSSIVSVLLLVFAFGLEDVASVYVPRLLAQGGVSGASAMLRWMLIQRTLVMLAIGALLAVGLPFIAGPAGLAGVTSTGFAHAVAGYAGLRAVLVGAYLAGGGIVALQGGFFASVLKTRATLIIGGVTQALGAALTLALIQLGYGLDGVFAAQALAAWVAAAAYLIVLYPYLRGRPAPGSVDISGARSLMVSAWLTNISNGALGKQMDILLMSLFAVTYAAIGFYNLAYQLVSVVGVLLISGLGGVSVAAMSVAYTARGRARLIAMWRAIIMLQLLLVIPFQVLTFALADQIIETIYGAQYAEAAPLLRIFLVFSFLGRLLGGGANQSALYVISKQRVVLVTRWIGFAINLVLDIILIHLAGPAGALIATGFSQLWVGYVEYLVLRREIKTRYPASMAVRVLAYSLVAAIPTISLAGLMARVATALASSLAAVFPAAASQFTALTGLLDLVALGALFIVVFAVAATLLGVGDAGDIVDLAAVNPRVQWVIALVRRYSVQHILRNRQVA